MDNDLLELVIKSRLLFRRSSFLTSASLAPSHSDSFSLPLRRNRSCVEIAKEGRKISSKMTRV